VCPADNNLCDQELCNENTCLVKGPDVKAVAWIDEFPCSGPEFDKLVDEVYASWCIDADCKSDPASKAIITAITLGLKGLCPTANNIDPPSAWSSPSDYLAYIDKKQFRGISQHHPVTLSCLDGLIIESNGCNTFEHHGYTPIVLPGGVNTSLYSEGVGQKTCTESGGTGTQCLEIDYIHQFRIAEPGAFISKILSGGFDVPWAFQKVKYKLCCPTAGETQGHYDVQVTGSTFPSHTFYLDGQAVSTHMQEDLGAFMYSNPPGPYEPFPPEVPLGGGTTEVSCQAPLAPSPVGCISVPHYVGDVAPCTVVECDPDTGDVTLTPECCIDPVSKKPKDINIPRVDLGFTFPFSSTFCKAALAAGYPALGKLAVTAVGNAKASYSTDPTCSTEANLSGSLRMDLELCGPGVEAKGGLDGSVDLQHCKECNNPPQWECGAKSCLQANFAGTYGKGVFENGVIPLPFTDPDVGLGIACGVKFRLRLEGTVSGFYQDPYDTNCSTCGPRCLTGGLTVTPIMQLRGQCQGTLLGASVTGAVRGGVEGSVNITAPIKPIGCGKKGTCATGKFTPHIRAELRAGPKLFGLGGQITLLQRHCESTWAKTSCVGKEVKKPWDCETTLIDVWPF
jgi:hypothetical protein